jgi:cytosine/adenosine deaminase-related metal-dependent hydrolase
MQLLMKLTLLLVFHGTYFLCFAQKVAPLDVLITNTSLVDVINKRIIENQSIGIQKGHIVLISSSIPKQKAVRIIDGKDLVALPGFIDTHTHLWQHICKSCFPNESLQRWVGIYRVVHYLEPDEIRKIVLAASGEALLSGITSVCDYASLSFNDYGFCENLKAIQDAGLGGVVVWHNPSIFLPDSIKCQEIIRYQGLLHDKLSIWMGPGPLSFHRLPQVYSGIRLAQRLHLHITEHTMENNQEQRDFYDSLNKYMNVFGSKLSNEDRTFLFGLLKNSRRPSDNDAFEYMLKQAKSILNNDQLLINSANEQYKPLSQEEKNMLWSLNMKRNISPIEILNYLNVLPGFLSIHSVWQQSEDIQLMQSNEVAVSHNPESNLYLSSGIAPVQDYLRSSLTVSIGTDGAASNDAIDFFSAMKAMWNVAKIRAMNSEISRKMDAWSVLQAATIGGAKSLFLDKITGSLDIGKEADITLVAKNELGMAPVRSSNLAALLIYSASPRNVKYVLSDGVILVEGGKLKGTTESQLAKSLTRIANSVDRRREDGKTWKENDTLKNKNLPYWFRYRSLRPKDEVEVTLVNATGSLLKLTVTSSAETFGGGTAYVADKEVLKRFPDWPANKSFEEKIQLQSGQTFSITKAKGAQPFVLHWNGQSKINEFKIGQLMILCENQERDCP